MTQETKRCTKCGEERPLSDFYFRKDKGIHYAHCKQCHNEYNRVRLQEYRKLHPKPQPQPLPEGHKRCSKCGEVKPYESFFRKSASKDGRESECKACYFERTKVAPYEKIFRGDDGRLYVKTHKKGTPMLYWTPNMLADLRRYYPVTPTREVAELLGVDPRTLTIKAKSLGIKKDSEYMRKINLDRCRMGGYMKYFKEKQKNQQQQAIVK